MPQTPVLTQPAVPELQAPTVGTYAEPVTAAAPTQPATTMSKQPKQSQNFCALWKPVRRQCPNKSMLPIHPEWSDLEGKKDLIKQENDEEQENEEEDWDGTRPKEKEQELKSNKTDSETPFKNNIKKDDPQLTDTLIGVLPISPPEEEEQTDKQCDLDDSEFYEADSEDETKIDNIV